MECKQYTDYEGNKVKIGDKITKAGINEDAIHLGKVISLRKEGFYVWVKTERFPNSEILGKFTKKVTS